MEPFTEKEMYKLILKLIEYPFSQICVHAVACDLLSLMEQKGSILDNDLVRAIVRAEDEISIQKLKGILNV